MLSWFKQVYQDRVQPERSQLGTVLREQYVSMLL